MTSTEVPPEVPPEVVPDAAPGPERLAGTCTTTSVAPAAFDLESVSIAIDAASVSFTANYAGDAETHNVVVRFQLLDAGYEVEGELFEDGSGVARVLDQTAASSSFVDEVSGIVPGGVTIAVDRSRLARLAGLPSSTVTELRVDGLVIEACELSAP